MPCSDEKSSPKRFLIRGLAVFGFAILSRSLDLYWANAKLKSEFAHVKTESFKANTARSVNFHVISNASQPFSGSKSSLFRNVTGNSSISGERPASTLKFKESKSTSSSNSSNSSSKVAGKWKCGKARPPLKFDKSGFGSTGYHCFLSYPFEIVEDRFAHFNQGRKVITESTCCDSRQKCPSFRETRYDGGRGVEKIHPAYSFSADPQKFDANNKVCRKSLKNYIKSDIYDGSGFCPAKLAFFCNSGMLARDAGISPIERMTVCPKPRENVDNALVERVFGGNPLWLEKFSHAELAKSLKSCVVRPEEHCGTAEQCGVHIFNSGSPLPSGCSAGAECCADAAQKAAAPNTRTATIYQIAQLISTVANKRDDIVITNVGDSTGDVLFYAMQQYSGFSCTRGGMGDFDWAKQATIDDEHRQCRFKPEPGWGIFSNFPGWALSTCIYTKQRPRVRFYFLQMTSILGNRTIEPTEWPYVWGTLHLGWTKESDEFRLKCSRLLLDVFARRSDAVLLNVGHHYNHWNYKQKLYKNWQLLVETFKTHQRDPASRLKSVVLRETSPSHFPDISGTGLFNWSLRKIGRKFATCVRAALTMPDDDACLDVSSAPPTTFPVRGAKITWYGCVPINTSAPNANWRNEAMEEAVAWWKEKSGEDTTIMRTMKYQSAECGSHNGHRGDCLHYARNVHYWKVITGEYYFSVKSDIGG
jgi:hypothetical protein